MPRDKNATVVVLARVNTRTHKALKEKCGPDRAVSDLVRAGLRAVLAGDVTVRPEDRLP